MHSFLHQIKAPAAAAAVAVAGWFGVAKAEAASVAITMDLSAYHADSGLTAANTDVQLKLRETDTHLIFKFYNTSLAASSITQLYFEHGIRSECLITELGNRSETGEGTDFKNAAPNSGKYVDPEETVSSPDWGQTAASFVSKSYADGVNNGEWIKFFIKKGSFQPSLTELAALLATPDFRIVAKLTGDNGGTAHLITGGFNLPPVLPVQDVLPEIGEQVGSPVAVPTPAAVSAGLAMLASAVFRRRGR